MLVSAARLRVTFVAAALAASLTAGVATATTAQAAPARKLPVAYLGSGAGSWGQPSVRPHAFLLGADWTISKLRWADWRQGSASGHGEYLACAGAAGPCTKFWAGLTLTHVRVHRGTRYFATMKITGKHRRTQWLVMNTRLGWWQPK
jgi:hypothetical protein